MLERFDAVECLIEECVAEAAIVGRVGARTLSGQIDRLVVTEREVTIIDYKTNRPPPLKAEDTPPIYIRQMAAYRAALAAIYPAHRIRCALLWTDAPRFAPPSRAAPSSR